MLRAGQWIETTYDDSTGESYKARVLSGKTRLMREEGVGVKEPHVRVQWPRGSGGHRSWIPVSRLRPIDLKGRVADLEALESYFAKLEGSRDPARPKEEPAPLLARPLFWVVGGLGALALVAWATRPRAPAPISPIGPPVQGPGIVPPPPLAPLPGASDPVPIPGALDLGRGDAVMVVVRAPGAERSGFGDWARELDAAFSSMGYATTIDPQPYSTGAAGSIFKNLTIGDASLPTRAPQGPFPLDPTSRGPATAEIVRVEPQRG